MESDISRASHIGRAHHIIVVDDDQLVRDTVGDYLRMHGFEISLCDGGASLRKTIAAQRADLIMLDLRMPGEDGLSIMRDLKRRISIPIIALTAIDDSSILELGFDDFIAKPFKPRDLLARVRVALLRNATMQPMSQHSPACATRTKYVRFGTKWLDHDAQILRDDDGNEVELSDPEYRLLKLSNQAPSMDYAKVGHGRVL
jgi:DNA-binding response OmpR family regulator